MRRVLPLALVVAVAACGGRTADDRSSGTALAYEVLTTGLHGPAEAREIAIRDAARFREVWPDRESPPAVDFDSSLVVFVALGQRPTGGYSVAVASVRRSDGGVIVRYVEREPGPGCMTTQALTAPYQVVKLPVVGGPVRFERRVEVRSCPAEARGIQSSTGKPES